MPHVVSTLSNDQHYTVWSKPETEGGKIARPAVALKRVLISGKANVANKITTPEGVITQVSDEALDVLKTVPLFQEHVSKGYMKIVTRAVDPDKAAKDMTARDESAPLNPSKGDFEPGGRAAGVAPGVQKII